MASKSAEPEPETQLQPDDTKVLVTETDVGAEPAAARRVLLPSVDPLAAYRWMREPRGPRDATRSIQQPQGAVVQENGQ